VCQVRHSVAHKASVAKPHSLTRIAEYSILEEMKLVANIQLRPTRDQEKLLRATLERCNEACNHLSQRGFAAGKIRQFDLHKLTYAEARTRFSLSAQMVVRCIAKVADAYKAGRISTVRAFRKHAAQPYDERIIRFVSGDAVSIWLLGGRQKIVYACGERQRRLLAFRKGEVDLMLVRGKWYVACVCDIPDPAQIDLEGVLGVDFGIVNLAFDSDGNGHTGSSVEATRSRLAKRKAGLQARGTKAAKRRLRKLSGKQRRFQAHTNHRISKAIVTEAQRSCRAIALEDLKGVRSRIKARRPQRARFHNWTFGQLRDFIAYKAKLAGVPVFYVDPRHTSRACPQCGTIDAKNRPNQSTFSCVSCGHAGPADHVAARNIRARAELVTRPQVLALS
jgi:putative transposase